jgi:hypothetical protein
VALLSGRHLTTQLKARKLGICWGDGRELACPFQRYVDDYPVGFWISEKPCPPCKDKVCGRTMCHAFGKPFRDENGRFAVVPKSPHGIRKGGL